MKLKVFVLISIIIPHLTAGFNPFNDGSNDEHLAAAKIIFFHGQTFNENEVFYLKTATNILIHPQFDRSKKTVMYCHGYMETLDSESTHVVVDAYIKNGGYNILLLDWSELSNGNYFLEAIPNTKKFGKALGQKVFKLLTSGVDKNSFHLVGHSLGGQLAGIIGRTIYYSSGNKMKLKRISALDPAFPPFYPGIVIPHISASDAEFVDVIHTDAGFYGAPVSTGTVDFWPNGGKLLQPGCPIRTYQILSETDLCSHRRSWRYWAESVAARNHETFYSMKCISWFSFKNRNCNHNNPVVQMGNNCPAGIQGDYYLVTNTRSPFSMNLNGITYKPSITKWGDNLVNKLQNIFN